MGKVKYPQNKKDLYKTWQAMNHRCHKDSDKNFHNYGGRGIQVCPEWRTDNPNGYMNFYNDMHPRPNEHTLDREDNEQGYSKTNCRWVRHSVNCRNTRKNVTVTYEGTCKTLVEWSEELGVSQNTLTYRRIRGWTDAEVIKGSRDTPFKQPLSHKITEDVFIAGLFGYFEQGWSQLKVADLWDCCSSQVSRIVRKQEIIEYYKENYGGALGSAGSAVED